MPTLYNRIANQNLDRMAALSDGIFAVAMTLLVLDLHLPASELIHSEHGLVLALWKLAPQVLVYLMSFLTLGIFWNGQQTQLNFIVRGNRDLSWLYLAFLFSVTMMPFSTQLLAHFIAYRTALLVYWLNILIPGLLLYTTWRYATRAKLLAEGIPLEVRRALRRRIVFAQSLYALGALLCIVSTRVSIGFILLVQLNYAIAPTTAWFTRKSEGEQASL